MQKIQLENAVNFGLPEIDDRYHFWRVPLLNNNDSKKIGEIVIDARTSLIMEDKSTDAAAIEARILGRNVTKTQSNSAKSNGKYDLSIMRNVLAFGNSEEVLLDLPANSVNLVFTSPPYFNARPEYNDYLDYEEYLLKIRKVIKQVHRVLSEGRFFVMNISPLLIRRANRNESSKRIAVPFDMHRLFIEEGYDFVDDIIWEKPAGAGWATGRGRRFAADRNPFKGDVVLDSFAGIGTTGKASIKSGRRFVLIEKEKKYVNIIKEEAKSWLGKKAEEILTINCSSIDVSDIIQMSMGYWPQEVAKVLKEALGYRHKLASMSHSRIGAFLAREIKKVPIERFVGLGVE